MQQMGMAQRYLAQRSPTAPNLVLRAFYMKATSRSLFSESALQHQMDFIYRVNTLVPCFRAPLNLAAAVRWAVVRRYRGWNTA